MGSQSSYWLVFLLILPLSLGNFNNGQVNPMIIGLLMIAIVAGQRKTLDTLGGGPGIFDLSEDLSSLGRVVAGITLPSPAWLAPAADLGPDGCPLIYPSATGLCPRAISTLVPARRAADGPTAGRGLSRPAISRCFCGCCTFNLSARSRAAPPDVSPVPEQRPSAWPGDCGKWSEQRLLTLRTQPQAHAGCCSSDPRRKMRPTR